MALFDGMAPWLSHLIIGLYLMGLMAFGGLVLAKARMSPLWVFLLLVPYVSLIAVYVFALIRWPQDESVGNRTGRLAKTGPGRGTAAR